MVRVELVGYGETFQENTMGEAIDEIRKTWCEEEGAQTILVLEGKDMVATLWRNSSDEVEICRTICCDGTYEVHSCKYILDAEGMYDHTVITQL